MFECVFAKILVAKLASAAAAAAEAVADGAIECEILGFAERRRGARRARSCPGNVALVREFRLFKWHVGVPVASDGRLQREQTVQHKRTRHRRGGGCTRNRTLAYTRLRLFSHCRLGRRLHCGGRRPAAAVPPGSVHRTDRERERCNANRCDGCPKPPPPARKTRVGAGQNQLRCGSAKESALRNRAASNRATAHNSAGLAAAATNLPVEQPPIVRPSRFGACCSDDDCEDDARSSSFIARAHRDGRLSLPNLELIVATAPRRLQEAARKSARTALRDEPRRKAPPPPHSDSRRLLSPHSCAQLCVDLRGGDGGRHYSARLQKQLRCGPSAASTYRRRRPTRRLRSLPSSCGGCKHKGVRLAAAARGRTQRRTCTR